MKPAAPPLGNGPRLAGCDWPGAPLCMPFELDEPSPDPAPRVVSRGPGDRLFWALALTAAAAVAAWIATRMTILAHSSPPG